MNIGEMRYDIVVLEKVSTRDAYGAETITYSTFLNLKAALKDMGGNKVVDANEFFSTQNKIFETHYRPTITEDMLIQFNTKKYRILNIQEIGFRTGLSITTELINE